METDFVGIFVLVQAAPVMTVDLGAVCKKLQDELGMKKEEIGIVSAYKQFVMRAYKTSLLRFDAHFGQLTILMISSVVAFDQ